jgi:5-formyltetrahydrofolate cyclo-ligase
MTHDAAMRFNESLPKQQLRQEILSWRRQIPHSEWRAKSDRLCHQLATHPWLQSATTVLGYRSIQGEPDLTPLLTLAGPHGLRRWGFPRCEGKTLHWHQWSPDAGLAFECDRYGIEVPASSWPTLSPEQVDLILVPAIAMTSQGERLGYGGGYYDRLLAQPEWRSIPTIGIIFHEQLCRSLPGSEWDQPLDEVCTD